MSHFELFHKNRMFFGMWIWSIHYKIFFVSIIDEFDSQWCSIFDVNVNTTHYVKYTISKKIRFIRSRD